MAARVTAAWLYVWETTQLQRHARFHEIIPARQPAGIDSEENTNGRAGGAAI